MISRTVFGAIGLVVGIGSYGVAQTCPVLPANKNATLVEYVQKKYRLDEHSGLKIAMEQPVQGSCYRQLTFEGKALLEHGSLLCFCRRTAGFLPASCSTRRSIRLQKSGKGSKY